MGTQHASIPGYDVQENQYIHLVVVNVFEDCTKSFYQLIMLKLKTLQADRTSKFSC